MDIELELDNLKLLMEEALNTKQEQTLKKYIFLQKQKRKEEQYADLFGFGFDPVDNLKDDKK